MIPSDAPPDTAGVMDRAVIATVAGRFACLRAGPADGALALCLHGFPDTPRTWRHATPALAAAGWRVVCPFLRGFAPTEVDDAGSGPEALGRDANLLHEALGGDARAVIVGHDWGAAAAFAAARSAPGRWRRVVALSWPPWPAEVDLASFAQMRRSWYVFLFQLPQAEALVGDPAFIEELWRSWSPGYDPGRDPAEAAAAISAGDGGRLVLEHYRALFRADAPAAPGPLKTPVLYVHGAADGCIGAELAVGLEANLPPASRCLVIEGAGHFPQLEQPDAFNRELLAFVGRPKRSA